MSFTRVLIVFFLAGRLASLEGCLSWTETASISYVAISCRAAINSTICTPPRSFCTACVATSSTECPRPLRLRDIASALAPSRYSTTRWCPWRAAAHSAVELVLMPPARLEVDARTLVQQSNHGELI